MQIGLVIAQKTTQEPCSACGDDFEGEFGLVEGMVGYVEIESGNAVCEDCVSTIVPSLFKVDTLLSAAHTYKRALTQPGLSADNPRRLNNLMSIAQIQRISRDHSPVEWTDFEGNEVEGKEAIVVRCQHDGRIELFYEHFQAQRIQDAMMRLLQLAVEF